VEIAHVQGLADLTLCDRYHLERLIGAGGMAQVWEASDLVLGRKVAVKVLHPHLAGDAAFVARFRAEAVAAARLSHPNIVGVYDTCSDGGNEAIVMELLDASTLRRYLDEHHTVDADTTVRIGLRLLDALEAAHRAGLVHRDVKPSNILLCADGRVKIADFGIAKADDQTELTQEGALVGTATYLAPEQLLGGDIDGRADLYSLGIVLYECLTGRVPFQGDTGAAVALARLHSDPIDPRRVRADVPPRIAEAVLRALQRAPDDRYDSAADLRAALLDSGVQPPPVPTASVPEVEVVEELPPTSFARSERGCIYPVLFILLVATALTVAGLLVRETAIDDDGAADTSTTTSAVPAATVSAVQAIPFDPQGSGEPGENDDLRARAIDGDPATVWRTESYDTPGFFGAKKGVGLGIALDARSTVSGVTINGSTNGWSGQLYVIDAADLQGVDPEALEPVATFDDVRAPLDLDLGTVARADRTGSVVLVWITDLGDAVDGGRHRVELAEVTVEGSPSGG
jgi:eukaryotic-like serine/threonine-protein kinase